ncbi:alpha/beta fold hydrolase [Actinomadura sp. 9N407]|uniref:alpha/beta fold hydrolase n=1 Tax=Actinomadura sp. 9N407 TaxID=3375154 RepID=UPI0037A7396B
MIKEVATSLGRIAVAVEGEGPPVLLLHANPGCHRDYDAVIPALAQRYATYAVDWPGYGGSARPGESLSAMAYARVLPEIVTGLGLDRAAVIGNSVGGYAAARLAIEHPDRVTALVLVNSGGFSALNPASRGFIRVMGTDTAMRLLAGRLPRFYLRRRTPAVREIIARDTARRRDPAANAVAAALWRSFAAPEHDLRSRAAAIIAPTLLVWGSRDPMVGMDASGVRRAMPKATWRALPTGHAPFAEAPERFLGAVLPFLDAATVPIADQ